tara:strand:- start:5224 stop:5646 length:423 start_codon:yes stop_codon:yes gene_type:complete
MSIDPNNIKPTSSDSIIIYASYSSGNVFEDNGAGLNVDEEHAIAVKTKVDIMASLRSEVTGEWVTMSIPPRDLTTINVSDFDLVNFYDLTDDSSRRRKIRIKALFNAYSDESKALDASLDALTHSKGKVEWLPKITIIEG